MHLYVASATISLSHWAWWPHWAATGTSLPRWCGLLAAHHLRLFQFYFGLKCMICLLFLSIKWSMSSYAGGKIILGCSVQHVAATWLSHSPNVSTHHCSVPGPAVLMVGGLMVWLSCGCHMLRPKTVQFSKECTWTHSELWFLSRLSTFSITEKVQLSCGCVFAWVYSN